MKIVRRVHMYAGLLFLPWIMFFGFSGMLFNHPQWFGPVEILSHISSDEMGQFESGGVLDADSNVIANEIVQQLNEGRNGSQAYRRLNHSDAVIEGTLNYLGMTDRGRTFVMISPNSNSANVRRFTNPAPQDQPDFHQREMKVGSFDPAAADQLANSLLEDAQLEPVAPLKVSDRGGSEVRFQLESNEDGRIWNVSYGLLNGKLSARAADSPTGLDFYSIVSDLHTTHHYPDRISPRLVWAIFVDLLGVMMIFWGISGLIMWWQIKPSRVLGLVGLTITLGIACVIFVGTFQHNTYGPIKARGPGVASPPPSGQLKGKQDTAPKDEKAGGGKKGQPSS